ncbi:MAG: hypothetical protein AB4040_12575 [Synechococcus sp.]
MSQQPPRHKHIILTSHPGRFGPKPLPIQWGHPDPQQRGPVFATLTNSTQSIFLSYRRRWMTIA